MANNTTGHPGSLTRFETLKLQETWIHLLRLCAHNILETSSHVLPDHTASHRQHLKPNSHHPSAATDSSPIYPITPAILRSLLWGLFQADHPDVMVLRFLRARKWDVDRSLAMLLSTLNWRHEQGLERIVKHGEFLDHQHKQTEVDKHMIHQYESGKALIRGADKSGRPIFIVRVRLHHPDAQTPESMERFVLHNIETIRSILRSQHSNGAGEKVCLIFDLTGFGMKNMDFHIVKFLILAFEARYPEYLGMVLVHNAPWVFWGIWRVVKPLLVPVIAAKIQFTSSSGGKDGAVGKLTEHIDPENLKSLGGTDEWVYKYYPPVAGENERMGDDVLHREARERLLAEREQLVVEFEKATLEWALDELSKQGLQNRYLVNGLSDERTEKHEARFKLARKLQQNFWALDPYVRARTPFHRCGVLGQGGRAAIDYKGR